MRVVDICTKRFTYVSHNASILSVARAMRKNQVGSVIVIDDTSGICVPEGIITSSDLVIEVLASSIDPKRVTAGDILNAEIMCLIESLDLLKALQQMRFYAARNAAVVNVQGQVTGLLSIEDLVPYLSQVMGEIAKLVGNKLGNKNYLIAE